VGFNPRPALLCGATMFAALKENRYSGFNPRPALLCGATTICTSSQSSIPVSIRAPRYSAGRPVTITRRSYDPSFQSAPRVTLRGDRLQVPVTARLIEFQSAPRVTLRGDCGRSNSNSHNNLLHHFRQSANFLDKLFWQTGGKKAEMPADP
jgi:hypothetical protein